MSRNVETVDPQTPIVEAARKMRDGDVGALPVSAGGRLVGMITDRDIVVRAIAEGRQPEQTAVQEVLTSDLFFVREEDSIEDAADQMAEHQVRRLPVLSGDEQLVGIVSLADVVRTDQDSGAAALDDISEPSQDSHS
jgi:CBS domain-containing protein